MEFDVLVEHMVEQPDVRREIGVLLERKRLGQELDREPRIPAISSFIEQELARLEGTTVAPSGKQASSEALDELFRWDLQLGPKP